MLLKSLLIHYKFLTMKKTISSFLFIYSIIFYQSCTAKILISDKNYAPTDPEKIELYYSKMPQREFEEIAIVYPSNGYSQSIKELKKTAAKIGANAILQIRFQRGYSSIAVRWK